MKCEWVHRKDTVERLQDFLVDSKNQHLSPRKMYLTFVNFEGEKVRA